MFHPLNLEQNIFIKNNENSTIKVTCWEEDERLLGEQLVITLLLMFIADPELLFGVKLELRRPSVFKLVVEDLLRGEESVLKSYKKIFLLK